MSKTKAVLLTQLWRVWKAVSEQSENISLQLFRLWSTMQTNLPSQLQECTPDYSIRNICSMFCMLSELLVISITFVDRLHMYDNCCWCAIENSCSSRTRQFVIVFIIQHEYSIFLYNLIFWYMYKFKICISHKKHKNDDIIIQQ